MTWSVWLLNIGAEPLCYRTNLTEPEAKAWCHIAAEKVFDGSDADAFIMLPSHKHPREVL